MSAFQLFAARASVDSSGTSRQAFAAEELMVLSFADLRCGPRFAPARPITAPLRVRPMAVEAPHDHPGH